MNQRLDMAKFHLLRHTACAGQWETGKLFDGFLRFSGTAETAQAGVRLVVNAFEDSCVTLRPASYVLQHKVLFVNQPLLSLAGYSEPFRFVGLV